MNTIFGLNIISYLKYRKLFFDVKLTKYIQVFCLIENRKAQVSRVLTIP